MQTNSIRAPQHLIALEPSSEISVDEKRSAREWHGEAAHTSSQFEEKIRTLLALRRVEETLQHVPDTPALVEAIFDIILEETGAENCSLMLLAQEADELALRAVKRGGGEFLTHLAASGSPLRLPIGEGALGRTAQHGTVTAIPDTASQDIDISGIYEADKLRALLCLPLSISGSTVGVITVGHSLPYAFNPADQCLLATLAERIASVMDQARVFDEWRRFNVALMEEVERSTAEQRRLTLSLQREVLDSRQAEAQLRQRERLLRELNATLEELVEHLPAGICLLDEQRRLILANPPAWDYLKILGVTERDRGVSHLGGRPLDDMLAPHPDGLPREIAVEGATPQIFEILSRPIAQGVMQGKWVLVIQDVTRERQILDRMRQQERLAAVGQLAAGIAHDFNNLLTVIIGQADLLETSDDLSEEVKSDLHQISMQGTRAAQLVQQILDFSRKSIAQRQTIYMKTFLKGSMKLIERVLPETITVSADFPGSDCIVSANATQLQQVLMNLVVNARDAMANGGALRIGLSLPRSGSSETEVGLPPGDWVKWTVADTGAGMTPAVLEHIFEPFFSTKTPDKGTGLGLAQVYGIVKQHGGEIFVGSAPGRGTTFSIYLPQSAPGETAENPRENEILKGQGQTILVVEDEPAVLRMTTALLTALNYRVLAAVNGRHALKVFDQHRQTIDLVLTDMVMPDMSGRELIESIQSKDPGLPIAIMTGYPLGDQDELLRLQGVAGLLEKPLVLSKLSRMIYQSFKRS